MNEADTRYHLTDPALRDKGHVTDAELQALTIQILENEKTAGDLETQAANIDAAVFDLKAVNPTAVVGVDIRTPQQIIGNTEAQGRIVADALARLNGLYLFRRCRSKETTAAPRKPRFPSFVPRRRNTNGMDAPTLSSTYVRKWSCVSTT